MAEHLDEHELEVWSSLATLLEWLPPALDAQLERDAGLTHFEFGIMFALAHAEDSTLRMSTLADYANSSLSRLSRAVARLEARDWVRRSPDPDDGRVTLAVLTPAGHRAFIAAEPGHVELVRHLVFDTLSAAQAKQLQVISRRIASAIRPS